MKEVRMECLRTPYVVSSNPLASMVQSCPSARTHGRVYADVPIYPLGNFIMDATVRPSYRRPSSHRPRPRPSVRPSIRLSLSVCPSVRSSILVRSSIRPSVHPCPSASSLELPYELIYDDTIHLLIHTLIGQFHTNSASNVLIKVVELYILGSFP
jgi:hypothetical protein